jgi:colanic acid biosynthesis glycosyl transferase WcaI
MVKNLGNKNILIHSLTFYPDQVSTASLYFEIAKNFVRKGANVTVFTSSPHYNPPSDLQDKLTPYLGFRKCEIDGIKVVSVFQVKTKNIPLRAVMLLYFHICFIIFSISKFEYDVILTPSPPLTSGLLSGVFARIKGVKSIYNVQEIHPDMLLKQNSNIKLFLPLLKLIERRTYHYSDKIVTIHNRFTETLISRTEKNKLICIPNFENSEYFIDQNAKKLEKEYFSGGDSFILGYFGNVGFLQDWDLLIEGLIELNESQSIDLLIIGGGGEFERLQELSLEYNFLTVMPYKTKRELNTYINLIDAHVIAMTPASDEDGLPSKIFSILGIGVPIIAITNEQSPMSEILLMSRNAVISPLGDKNGFVNNVMGLLQEDIILDSEYSKTYIRENYSKNKVLESYLTLINSLLK